MKQFAYFESEEGGMCFHLIQNKDELSSLYGWLTKDCKHEDELLISWMDDAEIGQLFEHRLGVMVRLIDFTENKQ